MNKPKNTRIGNCETTISADVNCDCVKLSLFKNDFVRITKDGQIQKVFHIADINYKIDNATIKTISNRKIQINSGKISICLSLNRTNNVCIEVSAPDDSKYPATELNFPDNDASRFEYCDDGLRWYLQKFSGRCVAVESGVAICMRRFDTVRIDGIKTVKYSISIVSGFENSNYISKCIQNAVNSKFDNECNEEFYVCLSDRNASSIILFESDYVNSMPTVQNTNILSLAKTDIQYHNDMIFYCLHKIIDKAQNFTYNFNCKGKSITGNATCKAKMLDVDFVALVACLCIKKLKTACDNRLKTEIIIPMLCKIADLLIVQLEYKKGSYVFSEKRFNTLLPVFTLKCVLSSILNNVKKHKNLNQYKNILNLLKTCPHEYKLFRRVYKMEDYTFAEMELLQVSFALLNKDELKTAKNTLKFLGTHIKK